MTVGTAWVSPITRENVARILEVVAELGSGTTREIADLANVFHPTTVNAVLHTLAAVGKIEKSMGGSGRHRLTLVWSIADGGAR